MRIGLLVYFLRKALGNIWTNPFISLVTLSTIAISMLILGLFSLIYLNVQQSLHQVGGELQITAYLQETISPKQAEVLRSKVADWPEVEGITYISKEQALARFRSQLREYAGILAGLKENPLPASLELTLSTDALETSKNYQPGWGGCPELQRSSMVENGWRN